VQELARISALPLVSIFEPLTGELAARAARRVAIFGTRYVISSELFGSLKNVEVIRPKPEEVDLIHNTYVELAATGKSSSEKHQQLTALAKTLVTRDAADAIILAGTDLTLLFNETNTDYPHIDCAALHIAAILDRLR
jgi:aspartate racemase